jgi:hypothetical protein
LIAWTRTRVRPTGAADAALCLNLFKLKASVSKTCAFIDGRSPKVSCHMIGHLRISLRTELEPHHPLSSAGQEQVKTLHDMTKLEGSVTDKERSHRSSHIELCWAVLLYQRCSTVLVTEIMIKGLCITERSRSWIRYSTVTASSRSEVRILRYCISTDRAKPR